MALVPYLGASGPLLAAEEVAAGELFSLVRGAAASVKLNNTVQAVKNVLQAISPYVTKENAVAVKNAAAKVVDLFKAHGANPAPSVVQKQLVAVRQLHRVLHAPSRVTQEVMPFRDIARSMRSARKSPQRHLVGVELNPGPKNRGIKNARAPAALSTRIVTQMPDIRMRNDGQSTRIRHRELLDASVLGSSTFDIQSVFEINPGLEEVFPWLAPQALQWEQYIAHSVSLLYIPIAPTDTQGTITISPSYDPSDPMPQTEQQLSNAVDTVEVTVWQRTQVALRKASMMVPGPRKYIRGAKVAGDLKTFDAGVVYVATNNCANANPIGKLWIVYDFEFFVPQNSPNVGAAPTTLSYFREATAQNPTSGAALLLDFDTPDQEYNPLNVLYDTSTNGFTPPKGFYRVKLTAAAYTSAGSGSFVALLSDTIDGNSVNSPTTMVTSAPTGGGIRLVHEYFHAFDGATEVTFKVTITATGTLTVSSKTVTFELV